MAAEDEKNRSLLQEVWKRKENAMCADCGQPDPCWVSCTLGTFICCECSEIHYQIPNISEVKSIKNGWEESQIQFLAQHGNALAKATYEAHVPAYYYRPSYNDCQVLREQWIRAKYERKEFLEPKKVLYSNGNNSMVEFLQYLYLSFIYAKVYAFCLKHIKTWEIFFSKQHVGSPEIKPNGNCLRIIGPRHLI
uniref:Arf-GAP domain-containing protein n=1 Tax=Laticauda laticaudata TaxID=8630 RepID=A0A8C5SD00_LATLA